MTHEQLAAELREKVDALKEVTWEYRSDHIAVKVSTALTIAAALEEQGREVAALKDLLWIVLYQCQMKESLRDNIAAALAREVKDEL